MQKNIIINSRKFDGTIHRSWKADLIEETESLLIFVGEFDLEVNHPHLGLIRRGTLSYEYYWKNDWFNVFRFHEPEGDLRNFYVNINKPPNFERGILNYIDLELDILVWKDFSYEILDMEEFEENAKKFKYSRHLRYKTVQTLQKILKLIENKEFPFNNNSEIKI